MKEGDAQDRATERGRRCRHLPDNWTDDVDELEKLSEHLRVEIAATAWRIVDHAEAREGDQLVHNAPSDQIRAHRSSRYSTIGVSARSDACHKGCGWAAEIGVWSLKALWPALTPWLKFGSRGRGKEG
jgi:hypothetical protein